MTCYTYFLSVSPPLFMFLMMVVWIPLVMIKTKFICESAYICVPLGIAL